jgi:hypothetical protein
MDLLVNSIASGSVQAREALAVLALACAPMRSGQAVRSGTPKALKGQSRHVELDRHTRQDIGLEPGSITWI